MQIHDLIIELQEISSGNEVDLLCDDAGSLYPVEIKSGQTVASDMFKAVTKWQAISGSQNEACLVFGGDGNYTRSGVQMLGWRAAYESMF